MRPSLWPFFGRFGCSDIFWPFGCFGRSNLQAERARRLPAVIGSALMFGLLRSLLLFILLLAVHGFCFYFCMVSMNYNDNDNDNDNINTDDNMSGSKPQRLISGSHRQPAQPSGPGPSARPNLPCVLLILGIRSAVESLPYLGIVPRIYFCHYSINLLLLFLLYPSIITLYRQLSLQIYAKNMKIT